MRGWSVCRWLSIWTERCIVVTGHGGDAVEAAAKEFDPDAVAVRQSEQLGTAHAVLQARDALDGFDGDVIVLYGDEDGPDPLHAELWERFWEYANDPELAREKGVRALQGEAPFMELKAGKKYRVNLRASDGLTIQAEW